MEKDEIKNLFKRYVNGECTEQEKAMLEAWYFEFNEVPVDLPPEKVREIGEEIFSALPGNKGRNLNNGFLLAAAAIGVVMVSLILQVVFHKRDLTVNNLHHEIAPGGNKAVLTLANGTKIDLAKAGTGSLALQRGSRILKYAGGQLTYVAVQGNPDGPAENNNITTPAGGIWEARLPDGTKVWLNNSSSLTYPSTFRGQKLREVTLEGEAYFEVAKDKSHPFTVKSRGQEVTVLGTHFDISAFKEEQTVLTTLLEGTVVVKPGKKPAQKLVPGLQSRLDESRLTITSVNLEQVMAWKSGYFRFANTPIQEVMRELARWYDIDIRYKGPVSMERLNGRISRAKNLSVVLNALEATKTVHFKVEGKGVTVMK